MVDAAERGYLIEAAPHARGCWAQCLRVVAISRPEKNRLIALSH
jgi:hypothetical protein